MIFFFEKSCLVSLIGHYGTGKTLLAAEVLKIWKGGLFEHNEEVDLIALTFDGAPTAAAKVLDYNLLNQELKSKYFQDQEEDHVYISHWQDFMKQIYEFNNCINLLLGFPSLFKNCLNWKIISFCQKFEN